MPKLEKVQRIFNVETREISLVPFGANNRTFALVKGLENIDPEKIFWLSKEEKEQIKKMIILNKGENMPTDEEIKKAADEKARLEKEAAEKKAKLEKEEADKKAAIEKAEKMKAEEIAKELAEKDRLAKENIALRDLINKSNERAENAEKLAKEEKQIRLKKEQVDFAKENLGLLGNPDEIGAMLHVIKELDAKVYESLTVTLKSANEKIKSGVFTDELGKDSTKTAQRVGKEFNSLQLAAKNIMEKEKVPYDVAVTKAIEQNPKLYEEYEASLVGGE